MEEQPGTTRHTRRQCSSSPSSAPRSPEEEEEEEEEMRRAWRWRVKPSVVKECVVLHNMPTQRTTRRSQRGARADRDKNVSRFCCKRAS